MLSERHYHVKILILPMRTPWLWLLPDLDLPQGPDNDKLFFKVYNVFKKCFGAIFS